MDAEQVTSTITIDAAPEAVFAVLADPTSHAVIDGTGWVSGSLDREPVNAAGQVFRMAMYHEGHPDGDYEIANLVVAYEHPRTIAWKPGVEDAATGDLGFGGWVWRYDLAATGSGQTAVTLTYDWSGATAEAHAVLDFPPFGPDHLAHSLEHLAGLVTS